MDTWAEREIEALRILFRGDSTYMAPTENQLTSLNSLLGKGLTNHKREIRIMVLRRITGIDNLQSSSQLTMHVASCLIDYFKNRNPWEGGEWDLDGKAKRLLAEVERGIVLELIDRSWDNPDATKRPKKRNMSRKRRTIPAGVGAAVPDLQPAGAGARHARGADNPW